MRRVFRKGRIFSLHWGDVRGTDQHAARVRSILEVRIEDGPETGRHVHVEMTAKQLGRFLANGQDVLTRMTDYIVRGRSTLTTADGQAHAADGDRPMCERLYLGKVTAGTGTVTCAPCIDLLIS